MISTRFDHPLLLHFRLLGPGGIFLKQKAKLHPAGSALERDYLQAQVPSSDLAAADLSAISGDEWCSVLFNADARIHRAIR